MVSAAIGKETSAITVHQRLRMNGLYALKLRMCVFFYPFNLEGHDNDFQLANNNQFIVT